MTDTTLSDRAELND